MPFGSGSRRWGCTVGPAGTFIHNLQKVVMTEAELRLEQLEQVVREALDEMKALDPVALDVRGKTPLTDMMFIVSGSSTRHVKSIADNVVEKVLEAGWRPIGIRSEEHTSELQSRENLVCRL